MPSERPYPGQLWKHDSTRVLVVAVHLNTVTYELLSGGQSITEGLGSFLAVFNGDKSGKSPHAATTQTRRDYSQSPSSPSRCFPERAIRELTKGSSGWP